MDLDTRIAQFENMCREDPDNDMAHFSLGNAYNQAMRFEEAAASYRRCFEANPAMTKAYQLCGAALMAANQTDQAAEVLTEGYKAAAERGDRMPQNAMKDLLEKLGAPVPEVKVKEAPSGAGGSFVCQRTGRPGSKLPRPPFKGPIGEWIHANISKETFDGWIAQGTKVINELRLDLSRDQDEAMYDAHMREYLGITDELYKELTGKEPPSTNA